MQVFSKISLSLALFQLTDFFLFDYFVIECLSSLYFPHKKISTKSLIAAKNEGSVDLNLDWH